MKRTIISAVHIQKCSHIIRTDPSDSASVSKVKAVTKHFGTSKIKLQGPHSLWPPQYCSNVFPV